MNPTASRARRALGRALVFVAFFVASSLHVLGQPLDLDKLAGLEARSIGPAGMSGRITAIDAVVADPDIVYAGSASGGLWKSTSGGVTWEPIFDDQPVASIGAISIYQKNPSIIYVGTGEGNPRNSQTNGNGVYKSIDGGRSWTHLGLDETRNIHRVIVHPDNPDVVYVGAQGPAWGETDQRGVFKSTDGGATWEKILYANEKTGVGEMVMDPSNPEKLIVAMWEFRRWPWFFTSGGEGSGMHVTFDGGKTWTERTSEDGLPEGELGRMGLAIARSNPNVVYALIEAKKTGLYRSEDGGFSFRLVNSEQAGAESVRPFYYAEIHVDTQNENRLYYLHGSLEFSDDGGKSFSGLTGAYNSVHPDHHGWWQDPNDANLIYDGNDGGLYLSRDRGASWRFVENLPLAQFYHINLDMDWPYNVMGGLQDNGSWHGPNTVLRAGGVRNSYWKEVGFGDGFDVMPDASDARYLYGMSQGGNLYRTDLVTGATVALKPTPEDSVELRFNWNAAIAQDPFDPETIYYGSQFVHKSTDRGDTWEVISPDLTTNDPEKQKQLESGGLTYDVTTAENHTTIIAIAPSPIEAGTMWVGTDDGNVQVTTDGGESWSNVVGSIRGVPEGTWVPQIQASAFEAGGAFVVFDDHRRNNWEPFVYQTSDYGRSWKRLVDGDDVWGFVLAVAQDPVEPNLIFVGTEFGLYVTIDAGETWTKWTNGFPTVSTMDLVIHPREHDLVVGTFGRSVYVLDDIRPLRELAAEGPELLEKPIHVFEAPTAYLAETGQADGTRFAANAEFSGETRPTGALLTFSINPAVVEKDSAATGESDSEDAAQAERRRAMAARFGGMTGRSGGSQGEEEVQIEVVNEQGEVIRTLTRSAKAGVNRTTWALRRKGARSPWSSSYERMYGGGGERSEAPGPEVLPGTYTVRFSYGGHSDSTRVTVEPDPRVDYDVEGMRARGAMWDRYYAMLETASKGAQSLTKAGQTLETVNRMIGDKKGDEIKELRRLAGEVKKRLDAFKERAEGKEVQGIRRDPNTLSNIVATAGGYLRAGLDAPGQPEERSLARAEAAMSQMLTDVNAFFAGEWAAFRAAVEAANLELFEDYEPVELDLGSMP